MQCINPVQGSRQVNCSLLIRHSISHKQVWMETLLGSFNLMQSEQVSWLGDHHSTVPSHMLADIQWICTGCSLDTVTGSLRILTWFPFHRHSWRMRCTQTVDMKFIHNCILTWYRLFVNTGIQNNKIVRNGTCFRHRIIPEKRMLSIWDWLQSLPLDSPAGLF